MNNLTIYDIEENTKNTAPYFFSRDTLSFFKQTMASFKVYKNLSGKIFIYAKGFCPSGQCFGFTLREYDPIGKNLLSVKNKPDTTDQKILKMFLNTL